MYYELNTAIEKQKDTQFLIYVCQMLLRDGVQLGDLLIILNAKLDTSCHASYTKQIRFTYDHFAALMFCEKKIALT